MIKKIILTVFAFCIMLFSILAEANCPCWKNLYLCPCTKNISNLVFIQNNAYAFSTNEGLLKSEDEGKTWTTLRNGLHWENLKMIGLVGNETSHFILATGDKPEFYEWQPKEIRWRKIQTQGIPLEGKITSFVQDSKGKLYISLDDSSRSNHNAGDIYQSVDFGIHWTCLKLKSTVLNNRHLQSCDILHTKLILDAKDNLYKDSFIYLRPSDKTQWIDTHYKAYDILILNNNLLGLVTDHGQLSIKQLKIEKHVEEQQTWNFHSPEENIKPVIVADQNDLYMIANSNLYQLLNFKDPESKWTWVKNSDVNMPMITCLAIHNHQLFAAGGRMNQAQSSIDIFQLT